MKKLILLFVFFSIHQVLSAQVALNATGSNNVFNIQYPANITSLSSGLMVTFFSNQTITNTGVTIVLNGYGPNNLYKNVNTPLTTGDILAGQSVTMIFDGTNWQLLSTSANVPTSNLWTVSGTNLLPTNQSTNIGLGTNTPQNKLDVKGSAAIGAFAGINTGPGNGLIISSNVGIGIPNPAQMLDVNGVARIRSLSISGAVFANTSGDLFINTATGISGAGTIGGVAFWTSNNTLSADGANFFYDRINSRLGIRNNAPAVPLDVSGGPSWSGNLANFTGNNPAGTNGIFVNTNLSGSGSGILINVTGGAGNRYGINANSSGSTGPTYGTFSMGASNGNTSYGLYATATGTGSNYGVYGSATGASGVGVYGTGAYSGIFMGGNVGVKTTSPSYPLDVNGDVNVSTISNIYRLAGLEALRMNSNSTIMLGGAGNSSSTAYYSVLEGIGAGASLTSGSYNVLSGYQAGHAFTTGSSNVMIGYNTGYLISGGNGNTMVGFDAGYNYSVVSGDYNTYLGAYADANVAGLNRAIAIGYAAAVGCSNCMAIGGVGTNSVNVGIGNPNPTTAIDIGNSTYQYNAYISLAAGNGSAYRQWQIGVPYGGATVSDPYYGFSIIDATAGVTRLAISYATGYVGIGITNPQYKLDVRGTSGNTINAVCSDAASGTSWGSSGMKAGVYGSGGAGSTQYQAGVYGYQIGSGFNSGGVVGAYSSGTWGALGYVNGVGSQYGGYFTGNVNITGTLSKGAGSFRIDHPLDPENKYLVHSFVESPDMMNIYNGMITTDASGLATVVLPTYFEALNMDFRYQLTVINEFAQAIVFKKIKGNQFVIKTDKPYIEVSWQVTGIRNDPYAQKHRIVVEEDKKEGERGKYVHPEEFGKDLKMGMHPSDGGERKK